MPRPRKSFVFPPEEGGDYRILFLGDAGQLRLDRAIQGFHTASAARKFILDNPELFLGKRFAVVLFHEIGRLDEEIQRTIKLQRKPRHAAETHEVEADRPEDAGEAQDRS